MTLYTLKYGISQLSGSAGPLMQLQMKFA